MTSVRVCFEQTSYTYVRIMFVWHVTLPNFRESYNFQTPIVAIKIIKKHVKRFFVCSVLQALHSAHLIYKTVSLNINLILAAFPAVKNKIVNTVVKSLRAQRLALLD